VVFSGGVVRGLMSTPNISALIFSQRPDDESDSMKPKKEFAVGDKIKVSMHGGQIVDAAIKAVIEETDGLKLQIDFGHEQTALIHARQVVED